jgi:hypothetical protein
VAALLRQGRVADADLIARDLIAGVASSPITAIEFRSDEYSLNSVSGRVGFTDRPTCFFKFHAEDGEEEHVGEYYRAQVLADAGLPVEIPIAVSTLPGRQMVLYELRQEPRMVDLCLDLERRQGADAALPPELLAARRDLDRRIGEVLVASVRRPAGPPWQTPAIHQLFDRRLTGPAGEFPGGRLAAWYSSNPEWLDVKDMTWTLNGVSYPATLVDLTVQAHARLDPRSWEGQAVATAHGDDHHGNVWAIPAADHVTLRLFDPAFAGDDVPALLALVKPTFHNVFAHPNWLYHPGEVDADAIRIRREAGQVVVDDGLSLSPLRQQVLDSITELAWLPLLTRMRADALLPPGWRAIVRSALLACPLLVTNLLAAERPPTVRLLGLARTVAVGTEPADGSDPLTRMLDRLESEVGEGGE